MAKTLGAKVKLLIATVLVGSIESINPPKKMRGETEVTDLDSELEEYLDHDVIDAGKIEFTVYHDVADESLDTIFAEIDPDDRNVAVEIQYTKSALKDTFNARILELSPEGVKVKDAMKRKVVMRLTSKPARSAIV